ncbi:putative Hydroxymethylpyrimidine phosphate kinase ThiD [Actinacidiphila bryophytorum]|uniref:Hydroxymethylpyrimidine phosphate kinase ThiD n=1 Tax=Actinacidiphila bryophytorum TaxID=1436133 RepID=A0A9W4MDS7_9ACTN|nr:putative Hydroxymethylpyrimidine phosphate kinase ThiD [Actinacidiphila bryophytorum]
MRASRWRTGRWFGSERDGQRRRTPAERAPRGVGCGPGAGGAAGGEGAGQGQGRRGRTEEAGQAGGPAQRCQGGRQGPAAAGCGHQPADHRARLGGAGRGRRGDGPLAAAGRPRGGPALLARPLRRGGPGPDGGLRLHRVGDAAAAAGPDPGGAAECRPRPRHREAAQGARPRGARPYVRQAAGARQPRPRRHVRLSGPTGAHLPAPPVARSWVFAQVSDPVVGLRHRSAGPRGGAPAQRSRALTAGSPGRPCEPFWHRGCV